MGDGTWLIDNPIVKKWVFATNEEAVKVLGPNDTLLALFDQSFTAKVTTRGTEVVFSGETEDVERMQALLSTLTTLVKHGMQLADADYRYMIHMAKSDDLASVIDMYTTEIGMTYKGKAIRVKTMGQRKYLDAIAKNDIVFGIGPAGTGKTYLAVAMAVMALKRGEVKRIVLTRPAVEAGEKLGFLPGDLQEKVDPYLRPLYDALHDIYGVEQVQRALERGNIEIAPLAYMRGRTLDDSYVILDEAQNATAEQMKMFLTRLGFHSKMVITGDVTQIDLPVGKTSGLVHAHRVLADVSGIAFHLFSANDVVRHHLVQKIIEAYSQAEERVPSAMM